MAFTSISRNLNEYIHRPGGLVHCWLVKPIIVSCFWLSIGDSGSQIITQLDSSDSGYPLRFVLWGTFYIFFRFYTKWNSEKLVCFRKKNFGISPFLALENSATGYFLAVFVICRLAPDGSIYFRILTLEVQPLTPDLRLGEQ